MKKLKLGNHSNREEFPAKQEFSDPGAEPLNQGYYARGMLHTIYYGGLMKTDETN
jgi:hypothetical protein